MDDGLFILEYMVFKRYNMKTNMLVWIFICLLTIGKEHRIRVAEVFFKVILAGVEKK